MSRQPQTLPSGEDRPVVASMRVSSRFDQIIIFHFSMSPPYACATPPALGDFPMPLSIFRRRLVVVAARALLGSSIACAAGLVTAQTFPTKPITLVVPFGAGSGTDLIARAFGQVLSTKFGVPVIIDNRGGANGVIAAQQVARAPAD